jgi:branched-chain amino acid aminotransferase
MKRTSWLRHVAVAHYSDAKLDYDPPVASVNAIGGQAQFSADAVQFGFGVFEGMRVYLVDDQYVIFRSLDHHERMVRSCGALGMPCPSYETFVAAIKLAVERNFVAGIEYLYIRPIVFATSGGIMAQQVRAFTFVVLCTPLDPYNGDIRVLVDTQNPRTVPMFSSVKTAANYASASLITRSAQKDGYDTVLWLDGNGFVQECTTMNVFFYIRGQLCTPRLGGILAGVTRRTTIELLRDQGDNVVERDIHIDEVIDGVKSGELPYFFTTSTALGIDRVTHLKHQGSEYRIAGECPRHIRSANERYAMLTRGLKRGTGMHRVIKERSYIGDVLPAMSLAGAEG